MANNHVYCDVVAGELICFFDQSNYIAKLLISQLKENKAIYYIEIINIMNEKFQSLGLQQADYFSFDLYLLKVEEGEEIMKINWLLAEYNKLILSNSQTLPPDFISENNFFVVPNSYYSLNTQDEFNADIVKVDKFEFAEAHILYKQLIGFDKMKPVKEYKGVLIIDSGIQTDSDLNIVKQVDFLSAYKKEEENNESERVILYKDLNNVAPDDYGHGTAIAKIINDICPGIPLTIFKIVNQDGICTEWDLVAALIAHSDAKIINISISYGLPSLDCNTCGRLSRSVRSYVLEYTIWKVKQNGSKLIVASGGNDNQNKLSFPARYNNTLGVVAMKKSFEKSSFSNYGNQNYWGTSHPGVISAFGGEKFVEPIFYSPFIKVNGWGTSFANCYVVGLLSYLWSRFPENIDNMQLNVQLSLIHIYTTKNFKDFEENFFGNGLICIGETSDKDFDRYIDSVVKKTLNEE